VPSPPRSGTASAAAHPGGRGRARTARPLPKAERARVETAWFASDDPLPFLAMLGAFLGRGFGKGARALRGVPAQGRRTARAVVRAPRQRSPEQPEPAPALTRTAPPEASAEPDELVTR
ncbi:ATP-grasp domain-containing protein, partial [Streptomyces sp. NPDC002587]